MSPQAPQPPEHGGGGPPVCAGLPRKALWGHAEAPEVGAVLRDPGTMAQASSLSLPPRSLGIPHEPVEWWGPQNLKVDDAPPVRSVSFRK